MRVVAHGQFPAGFWVDSDTETKPNSGQHWIGDQTLVWDSSENPRQVTNLVRCANAIINTLYNRLAGRPNAELGRLVTMADDKSDYSLVEMASSFIDPASRPALPILVLVDAVLLPEDATTILKERMDWTHVVEPAGFTTATLAEMDVEVANAVARTQLVIPE